MIFNIQNPFFWDLGILILNPQARCFFWNVTKALGPAFHCCRKASHLHPPAELFSSWAASHFDGLKLRWWKVMNLIATLWVFFLKSISLQMLRIESERNGTHSEESQMSPQIPERCYHYLKFFCSRAKSVFASLESCRIDFCTRSTIILFCHADMEHIGIVYLYICFVLKCIYCTYYVIMYMLFKCSVFC